MSFNPADFHPKFVAAMEALERIPEAERRNHPNTRDLTAQAMAYAPESLQAIFRAKAREMGLLPDPSYYTEDGEPVYTTTALADHLGISVEEANRLVQEMDEEHPEIAFQPGKTLYRRQ